MPIPDTVLNSSLHCLEAHCSTLYWLSVCISWETCERETSEHGKWVLEHRTWDLPLFSVPAWLLHYRWVLSPLLPTGAGLSQALARTPLFLVYASGWRQEDKELWENNHIMSCLSTSLPASNQTQLSNYRYLSRPVSRLWQPQLSIRIVRTVLFNRNICLDFMQMCIDSVPNTCIYVAYEQKLSLLIILYNFHQYICILFKCTL